MENRGEKGKIPRLFGTPLLRKKGNEILINLFLQYY